MKRLTIILAAIMTALALPVAAMAQATLSAEPIQDASQQAHGVYRHLSVPDEVDVFSFTAQQSKTMPVEVYVPARPSNRDFRPSLAVYKPGSGERDPRLPIAPPDGYVGTVTDPPASGKRHTLFMATNAEKLYTGRRIDVTFEPGQTYYFAVYDPEHYTGDYILAFGSPDDLTYDLGRANVFELVKTAGAIKFAVPPGRDVPWQDLAGIWLSLVGLIIALGGISLLDVMALLARKSKYWTETIIRAHKVSKWINWAGLGLVTLGVNLLMHESGAGGVLVIIEFLLLVIAANALYMSLHLSPELMRRERAGKAAQLLPKSFQRKAIIAYSISFTCWWSLVALFGWYLIVAR